jgi:DNA-binding response OmpR family regulator
LVDGSIFHLALARGDTDMQLLLVEDDRHLAATMASVFQREGWEVTIALDGHAALRCFERGSYHVVVIDWVLPPYGPSGLELCKEMRQRSPTVGILFASGKEAVKDRLLAFEAGADDYLVKPFEHDELVARVSAIARRSALWPLPTSVVATDGDSHYLACESIKVDMATLRVTVEEEEIELTLRQLLMLVYLMRHRGRLVSEAELREQVLRTASIVPSSTIRNHIHQLREKLGAAKVLIHSVHGKGYGIGLSETASMASAESTEPIACGSYNRR